MIEGMFNDGAMPALERTVQFTAQRHKLLSHNVANISTPQYQPVDLDTDAFQAELGRAIDERRERTGGPNGPLNLQDTRQLDFRPHGIDVEPRRSNHNILFHDRNNRSLERLMQHVAENAGVHNTALDILHNEFQLMETAIRERV